MIEELAAFLSCSLLPVAVEGRLHTLALAGGLRLGSTRELGRLKTGLFRLPCVDVVRVKRSALQVPETCENTRSILHAAENLRPCLWQQAFGSHSWLQRSYTTCVQPVQAIARGTTRILCCGYAAGCSGREELDSESSSFEGMVAGTIRATLRPHNMAQVYGCYTAPNGSQTLKKQKTLSVLSVLAP